jgi:rod shape-determining protein MreC
MSSLNPARQNALLLIALLFVQLLLMAGNVRDAAGSTLLEKSALRISQPVVAVSRAMGGGFSGVTGGFRDLTTARKENVHLRDEVVRLRGELDRYREESIENQRLRQLLMMKEHIAPRSIGAAVVTAVLSDQEHVIVVNRGTSHGVAPDQPVIAWGGAVGRVVFADSGHAKIRLLTDPNSGVAGLVQRSRQEGMILGRGKGLLEMVYVPSFADVALGDRIVTSGIDGVFPKGVGIGVVQASEAAGIARTILLEPEVEFSHLEEVLILVEAEEQPQDPAEPESPPSGAGEAP